MKKKIFLALLIITFITIGIIVYFISNITGDINDAESAFEVYLDAQGVNEKNIKTKEINKNYKLGGYDITVTYKDEPPSYVYDYFYSAKTKDISLIVFDDGRGIEEGMKYPPIDKNE